MDSNGIRLQLRVNKANANAGNPNSPSLFEYKFTAAKTLYQWASAIHELGAQAPGTYSAESTYKQKLEAITTLVTKRNALSSGNNYGNALAQLRTNEIDWDPNTTLLSRRVWEFREHKLTDCALGANRCFLSLGPLVQTPDDSLNRSTTLDNYLVANEAAILNETNVLPTNFGSYASHSGGGAAGSVNEAIRWETTAAVPGYNSLARHLFGFAACNGCHYSETGIDRMHIKPRKQYQKAALSAFLGVNNAVDPLAPDAMNGSIPAEVFTVDDPVSLEPREYNEPWRRACELKRILNFVATPYTKASGAH